jgi:hypothetical protein
MSVMAVMHRIRLDHLQTFFCKFTDEASDNRDSQSGRFGTILGLIIDEILLQ